MPNVKKQKSVAKLKKECDAVFSKYIRYRDGEKRGSEWYTLCITCQKWYPRSSMQNGHFVSRRVTSLRYDEENCNGQCVGCNMFKAGEQYQYSVELDLKYGEGTAKRLHDRRFETHSFKRDELEQMISEYKGYIEEYEKL